MAFRTVRGPYALPRNPHKVGVQFSVRILIVEDRYCVGAGSDARELADRMPIGDHRRAMGNGLVPFLGKVWRGGEEVANCLALVITQSRDFDLDLILLRRLCLRQGGRRNQQEGSNEGHYFTLRLSKSQRTSPFFMRRRTRPVPGLVHGARADTKLALQGFPRRRNAFDVRPLHQATIKITSASCQFNWMDLVIELLFPKVHISQYVSVSACFIVIFPRVCRTFL